MKDENSQLPGKNIKEETRKDANLRKQTKIEKKTRYVDLRGKTASIQNEISKRKKKRLRK